MFELKLKIFVKTNEVEAYARKSNEVRSKVTARIHLNVINDRSRDIFINLLCFIEVIDIS